MVVEADESDGSFLRLDGTIAVVTNIDPEHLDHYGGFDRVKDAYCEFVANVPFYGAALLCIDHPEVQAIVPRVQDRRVVTYGFAAQADIRADNVTPIPGGSRFDATIRDRHGAQRTIAGIHLPMPGRHNVQNALAAIGVAIELGGARRGDRDRLRRLRRRQAPLHQGRRGRRRHDHRRLRPSSGRDQGGAGGGAGRLRPAG